MNANAIQHALFGVSINQPNRRYVSPHARGEYLRFNVARREKYNACLHPRSRPAPMAMHSHLDGGNLTGRKVEQRNEQASASSGSPLTGELRG